jgi:diketogulonate reductase-like aldo/keto reductase
MEEPVVRQVAADCKHTPAQVLLRWALQRGSLPLPKTVTPERSEENGLAWHGWRLSEAQMHQLTSLDRQRRFFRGDNVSLIGQPWELNWVEDASVMS